MDGYRSAVQFAYGQVKAWILDHTLKPSQRIDQDELASMLGLSRTPVRTALEKLASEGLVEVAPHRGVTVTALSHSELEEVYMLRELLEIQATRLTVHRISAEELAEVERLMLESEQRNTPQQFAEYLELNRAFHLAIYRGARSPVLLRLICLLWDMSDRYRAAFLQMPGRVEHSMVEHREIVRKLADRDEEGLVRYLVQHNARTKDMLSSSLEAEAAAPR